MTLAPPLAGLCSVTFRALSAKQIVDHAAAAGIEAIEWGGDAHVPHGDIEAAREARALCDAASIACPSYGSYLIPGTASDDDLDGAFAVAQALGSPTIRIWPGERGRASDTYGAAERRDIAAIIAAWAGRASKRNMRLGLEFHRGSLADTIPSLLRLLDEIGDERVMSYWQWEPWVATQAEAADQLNAIDTRLCNVHVFNWDAGQNRHSLAGRLNEWTALVRNMPVLPEAFYLEFLPGDDPGRLSGEAATLRAILAARPG